MEVARTIETYRSQADLVVIHDWMIAMFYAYHLGVDDLVALGENSRSAGGMNDHSGVVRALDALPDDSILLLVTNRIADHSDPRGLVVETLLEDRPLLKRLPCSSSALAGLEIFCKEIYLLGAKEGAVEPLR